MVEAFVQMIVGAFAMMLTSLCISLIGGVQVQEQIKILFMLAMCFYILLPFILLGIERRLWEKAGYLLRQFHFAFSVITIVICLLFLIIFQILRLTGLIGM
jgi:hypothetical protein